MQCSKPTGSGVALGQFDLFSAEEVGLHVLQVRLEVLDVVVLLGLPLQRHLLELVRDQQPRECLGVDAAEEQLEVQLWRVVCLPRLLPKLRFLDNSQH